MVKRSRPKMLPSTVLAPLQIVNLGSSFAAGPGIPPQINTAAARSGNNYAHLVANKLNANLTDLSVSGATLQNILNKPQGSFPPEVDGVPSNADVVFVLGGGNDLGYVGGLTSDSFGITPSTVGFPTEDQLVQLYIQVLEAINSRAPKARVFVVEYLTILGPDVKPGSTDTPFNASRVDYHRGVAATLQRATARAADANKEWVTRVPVAELSLAHGLGSSEPWVVGARGGGGVPPWHPREKGMEAVAGFLEERIGKLTTRNSALARRRRNRALKL